MPKTSPAHAVRSASPLRRLLNWLRGRPIGGRKARTQKDRQRRLREQLFPKAHVPGNLKEWKALRQANLSKARAFLEDNKPIPAIHLLGRALLTDPDHGPYQSLIKRAIQEREKRRGRDAVASLLESSDAELRDQVLCLEMFHTTVNELERLLDKAGVAGQLAPPPRQGKKK